MMILNFPHRHLLILLCLLPISLFAAQRPSVEGPVLHISNSHINVNDMQLPLLSTARALAQPGNKALALKDIKKGDYVRARLRKMNNQLYVDLVERLPENLHHWDKLLRGKGNAEVLKR